MSGKIHIETYGCQMNKLDSDLVYASLAEAGWVRAPSVEEADVVLFNTCSVRQHAEDRVYSNAGAVGKRKKNDPSFILGIMGCMAQKEGEQLLSRVRGLDLVVGTNAFPRMSELIDRVRQGERPLVAIEREEDVIEHVCASRAGGASRHAFVSIMRGCENFCAYCVVPYVRGPEVSRSPGSVVDEVKRLVESGVLEVTLLGQNVNSYGKKAFEQWEFPDLLEELNAIDGLSRIRFVTNHPKDMDEAIVRAVGELPKVMESFHVPAQAGSNRVLDAMKRGYTREQYLELVRRVREVVSLAELTSDFIVGFPGETEEDFRLTFDLVGECEFRNSYIFKYSPRPGTAASGLTDDVPDKTKRRRHKELLDLQREISARRYAALVGTEQEVLVEGASKRDARRMTGRSRGDHIVVIDDGDDLVGEIAPIRITAATALALYGRDR